MGELLNGCLQRGGEEVQLKGLLIGRLTRHLTLVAHDCGYPLSRYTCRATRVAADFLDFIAFCRCSNGVALHPLKILVSHLDPPRLCREVSHRNLGLKRCRATRGCRSYSCGCRATCATKHLTGHAMVASTAKKYRESANHAVVIVLWSRCHTQYWIAPMCTGILSRIVAGVWRQAPGAFPDSNAILDTFQSVKVPLLCSS